ncbi:hypothetical protein RRG43_02110 [Mycoplasmopsis cynos]|uniref:trigger factor-related chaperone n=1 Tax=Mycoplasmopsis cynos TaxID=171284 RepID=UPI002AFF369F|nr:hypothetical protein [Mycoplasmopsis cynos]WQQ15125.1 hypothetical protein RRG43_02110 [Mycoplasmopsis cynos]
MKHIIKDFKIDGTEWIKIQNDALKFLESKNQKINQQVILEYAVDAYGDHILNNEFKLNNQKIKENKYYFRPIILNKKFSINEFTFQLKSYYLDEEFTKNLKIDQCKKVPFSMNPEYETQINEFTKSYINNFKFRDKKEINSVINEGDVVHIEALHKGTNRVNKFEIIASSDIKDDYKDVNYLENKLIGKNVGETFTFEANKDVALEIKIEEAFTITPEPITDENAYKIGIEELKTLDDVKKYIRKSILEQIISETLFEFGWRVLESIRESNEKIELPEDLVNNDIEAFQFESDFVGDKKEVVEDAIISFFWFNFVAHAFDISIFNKEINYEIKRVKTFLNMENNNDINIRKIADAILLKKLALKILEETDKSFIEKFKDYIVFE